MNINWNYILLVLRAEQSQRHKQDKEDLREKLGQLEQDFDKERSERFYVASDMIRQYKMLQSDLFEKINKAERRAQEFEDKLAVSNIALKQTREKKDAIIERKTKENEELKQKMEDMVVEFSEMLKQTLNKMGRTIVESAQSDTGQISYDILQDKKLQEIIGDDVLDTKLKKIRLSVETPANEMV